MPRIPIDYSKIVIYKLVNKEDYDNANIYIGSTANFTQRKFAHKSDCMNENKNAYNQKIYQFIRENGGWNEWNMIEVEKYPCVDNNEAYAREEHWRIHFKASLRHIAF
jgi:predicted GIY-YIG superfamily endonuclease